MNRCFACILLILLGCIGKCQNLDSLQWEVKEQPKWQVYAFGISARATNDLWLSPYTITEAKKNTFMGDDPEFDDHFLVSSDHNMSKRKNGYTSAVGADAHFAFVNTETNNEIRLTYYMNRHRYGVNYEKEWQLNSDTTAEHGLAFTEEYVMGVFGIQYLWRTKPIIKKSLQFYCAFGIDVGSDFKNGEQRRLEYYNEFETDTVINRYAPGYPLINSATIMSMANESNTGTKWRMVFGLNGIAGAEFYLKKLIKAKYQRLGFFAEYNFGYNIEYLIKGSTQFSRTQFARVGIRYMLPSTFRNLSNSGSIPPTEGK